MNLATIASRITDQQAIIEKLSADMLGHASIVKTELAKIQAVSLAVGMG